MGDAKNEHYANGGIRSKERSSKYGEVFTPEWMVVKMCDLAEKEAGAGLWRGNILEPTCGTGNFLVEIARRKLALGMSPEEAAGTLFGVDLLPDNVAESIERLLEILPGTRDILERNIAAGNFLTKRRPDGKPIWFLAEYIDGGQTNLFDSEEVEI